MVTGKLGFHGTRLTQARLLRRLATQTALADLTEISKQMIGRYESGGASPTLGNLEMIAAKLNLPISFFLRAPIATNGSPIMYRSMRSALGSERARARELVSLTADSVFTLENYVDFPEVTLPRFNIKATSAWSKEEIEEAARQTRQSFGFPSGPLPNLVTLCERAGGIIVRTELAETELDGVSQVWGSRPIVVINSTKSPARSRFDLAHELGHAVLHSTLAQDTDLSPEKHRAIEKQAHQFAGALLLPREEFMADIWTCDLDEFAVLKPKWQVSIQAMVQRAFDIGLLDEDEFVRKRKQISFRKWRTNEPLESSISQEMPSLLFQALRVVVEDFPAGGDVIRSELPFGNLLGELAGVPESEIFGLPNNRIVDIREYKSRTDRLSEA